MSDPAITVFGAPGLGRARTAVIIPARNEADSIAACLVSLAGQETDLPPAICLCVNNTTDATARIAADLAPRLNLSMLLIETPIPLGGVGMARRIGHRAILGRCPVLRNLLSTDADCRAAPHWLAAMEAALVHAPAVLGRIEPDTDTGGALSPAYLARARIEAAYLALSMAFERLLDPRGGKGIGLNTAGGANLGLRTEIYASIGGYRALRSNEDRDLVARVIAAGYAPSRAPGAVVAASMRSVGRAPGGMAAGIANRLAQEECTLDSALAPLREMLSRHLFPPETSAPSARMTTADAQRDMAALAACVSRLRRARPDTRRHLLHDMFVEITLPVPSVAMRRAEMSGGLHHLRRDTS